MKRRRIVCAITAVVMLVAAFAACTVDPAVPPDETSGTSVPTDTQPDESTSERIMPDLPDITYDGDEISFLVWNFEETGSFFNDITSHGTDGTLINDATYNRNIAVEEKYKVKIKTYEQPRYSANNIVTSDVNAGDCTYNVVVDQLDTNLNLAVQGYYMNLNNLDYLDFDKPWWDSGVVRDLSIGKTLFIASGDILIRDNGSTVSVIFNMDMANDRKLESPFDLVDSGAWTLDKMYEMAKGAAEDVGGDGVMDTNDRYGLLGEALNIHMLYLGAGLCTVERDSENYLSYTGVTDQSHAVLEKAYSMLTDEFTSAMTEHWDGGSGSAWGDYNRMFISNQSLFMIQAMEHLMIFKDMDSWHGIVPLPKADETQKDYYSTVNMYWFTNIALERTNLDPEMVSVILEAMAAESYYGLNKCYYDTLVENRWLDDQDSVRMLKMILANRRFDMAVYGGIGDFHFYYKQTVINRSFDIMSSYMANLQSAEKKLSLYIKKYDELQFQ